MNEEIDEKSTYGWTIESCAWGKWIPLLANLYIHKLAIGDLSSDLLWAVASARKYEI